MKRSVLAMAMLLGFVAPALADTGIYNDITGQNRSDNALQAATAHCARKWGTPQNGDDTSPGFKQCMVGQGWLFREAQVTPEDAAADEQAVEDEQDQANAEAQQEEEEQEDEERSNDDFNRQMMQQEQQEQMMLQEQQNEQTQEMVNAQNALAAQQAQQAQQQAIDEQNAMSQPQN